jgi:hypothetical protein
VQRDNQISWELYTVYLITSGDGTNDGGNDDDNGRANSQDPDEKD